MKNFNEIPKVELDLDLVIFGEKDIENKIDAIKEFAFDLDAAKNMLRYSSNYYYGIIVNISRRSLKVAYDKFQNKGLFDLNIRRFIPNKAINKGIKKTIEHNPNDFLVFK